MVPKTVILGHKAPYFCQLMSYLDLKSIFPGKFNISCKNIFDNLRCNYSKFAEAILSPKACDFAEKNGQKRVLLAKFGNKIDFSQAK